jgi:diamine N-acetyltransferase
MAVTLEPITQDNWIECINLAVSEEQQHRHAVAPNVLSLAQAYAEPWWMPLAIYADDPVDTTVTTMTATVATTASMVGFVMFGRQPGTAINYILRVMVDARYQGRGYGKAALAALIDRIRQEDSDGEIQLDYDPDDPVAVRLYAGAGFREIERLELGVLARLA